MQELEFLDRGTLGRVGVDIAGPDKRTVAGHWPVYHSGTHSGSIGLTIPTQNSFVIGVITSLALTSGGRRAMYLLKELK
jgi:hypothetical protein